MVAAINKFLPLVAQAWNVPMRPVIISEDKADVILIGDDSKCENGICAVGCAGLNPLVSPDCRVDTVSCRLFHKLSDRIVDEFSCAWWMDEGGTKCYKASAWSPVAGNRIVVSSAGGKITLCDFIYPGWLDRKSDPADTQYNFTNTLSTPFSVDNGGRVFVMDDNLRAHWENY